MTPDEAIAAYPEAWAEGWNFASHLGRIFTAVEQGHGDTVVDVIEADANFNCFALGCPS